MESHHRPFLPPPPWSPSRSGAVQGQVRDGQHDRLPGPSKSPAASCTRHPPLPPSLESPIRALPCCYRPQAGAGLGRARPHTLWTRVRGLHPMFARCAAERRAPCTAIWGRPTSAILCVCVCGVTQQETYAMGPVLLGCYTRPAQLVARHGSHACIIISRCSNPNPNHHLHHPRQRRHHPPHHHHSTPQRPICRSRPPTAMSSRASSKPAASSPARRLVLCSVMPTRKRVWIVSPPTHHHRSRDIFSRCPNR